MLWQHCCGAHGHFGQPPIPLAKSLSRACPDAENFQRHPGQLVLRNLEQNDQEPSFPKVKERRIATCVRKRLEDDAERPERRDISSIDDRRCLLYSRWRLDIVCEPVFY